jgi:ribosome-associated heat shock protein Hsp15
VAEAVASVRIDKWLWAARVFKTRSLAAAACQGGKVDVNDDAAKPAKLVRPGDVVRVTLPLGRRRIVKVVVPGERRGGAAEARELYEDLTPPEPPRLRQAPPPFRPMGAGRPTKRERRQLDRLRGF